jgi:tRNA(fMet)-specific endonuclease VapC
MKGDEQVIATLRRLDRIGFSAISIGELFSGFKGGHRENRNRQELDLFKR